MFTTLIFNMQYFPHYKLSHIIRIPFCHDYISITGGLLGGVDLATKAFQICTAQLALIKGQSRTWAGERALLDIVVITHYFFMIIPLYPTSLFSLSVLYLIF